jgi:hypothetical protein
MAAFSVTLNDTPLVTVRANGFDALTVLVSGTLLALRGALRAVASQSKSFTLVKSPRSKYLFHLLTRWYRSSSKDRRRLSPCHSK